MLEAKNRTNWVEKGKKAYNKWKPWLINNFSSVSVLAAIGVFFIYFTLSQLKIIDYGIGVGLAISFVFLLGLYAIGISFRYNRSLDQISTAVGVGDTTIPTRLLSIQTEISSIHKIPESKLKKIVKLKNLVEVYEGLNDEGSIGDFKESLVDTVYDRLRDLKLKERIENLYPDDTFKISTPRLKKLEPGDQVYAVSFLHRTQGEWALKNEHWIDYTDANIKASRNGAKVERIFIVNKEEMKEALSNDQKEFFLSHTIEKAPNGNFRGYVVDELEYKKSKKIDRNDRWNINEGFIIIISQKGKFAILDDFPNVPHMNDDGVTMSIPDSDVTEYRTTATFDDKEICGLIESYVKLKKLESYRELMLEEFSDNLNGSQQVS